MVSGDAPINCPTAMETLLCIVLPIDLIFIDCP